ncbi:MAG: NUDIX domain-containing protein [Patescibacteria group bacterium]
MSDELIDICDKENNLTGEQKMKSEAHEKGLWHRAAHIWIYNSQGEVLLQLRAKEKLLFPNLWDVSVGGHVIAGEDPIDTGIRELEEEIGLNVQKDDLYFFKIIKDQVVSQGLKNNEFYYVYFLKYDGDPHKLKLQVEEVQEIKFFPIEKITKELKTKPEKFVAPYRDYWSEVLNEIKKINPRI